MVNKPSDKCTANGKTIITVKEINNTENGSTIVQGDHDAGAINVDRINNTGSVACVGGCGGKQMLVILL